MKTVGILLTAVIIGFAMLFGMFMLIDGCYSIHPGAGEAMFGFVLLSIARVALGFLKEK
jgi:hypothetical protein